MNTLEFSRDLIKGKIAETVFEQMFRDSGKPEAEKYTILKFGYEYTLPEIAQYMHLAEIPAILKNIRNAPDFVLVSQDRKKIYLVEVKYQKQRFPEETGLLAKKITETWNSCHLFIASPDRFSFSPCSYVIKGNGNISPMQEIWVTQEKQDQYLALLNEFEK